MSTKRTAEAVAPRKLWRSLAERNANRHLQAYLLERDPRHIAAAWRDFRKLKIAFRKLKIAPSEKMLRWLDRLAEDVLAPRPAQRRPRKNLVRDLEIYRLVNSFRKRRGEDGETELKGREIYAAVGKPRGLNEGHVKAIYSNVKRMLEDPYNRPKAYR